jgi:hypothetical protein
MTDERDGGGRDDGGGGREEALLERVLWRVATASLCTRSEKSIPFDTNELFLSPGSIIFSLFLLSPFDSYHPNFILFRS